MSCAKPIFWNPEKPLLDRYLSAGAGLLIFLYQKTLSPLLGSQCRFHPSCSQYARQAFASRPFFTACRLTLWRLCKCQPFHSGGYDPLDPEEQDAPAAGHPQNQTETHDER